MNNAQVKNLITTAGVFILSLVMLISNFSKAAMIAIILGVVILSLATIVLNKKQTAVTENLDIYGFFIFIVTLLANYSSSIKNLEKIVNKFNKFARDPDAMGLFIGSLIGGIIALAVIFFFTKRFKNAIFKSLIQFTAIFFYLILIDYSSLHNQDLLIHLIILSVIGMIINIYRLEILHKAALKSQKQENNSFVKEPSTARTKLITIVSGMFLIFVDLMVKMDSMNKDFNIWSEISESFLHWYTVLAFVVFGILIMSITYFYFENDIDFDAIFFSGLVGIAILAKSLTYFYFNYNWVILLVFLLLWFSSVWQSIKNEENKAPAIAKKVSIKKLGVNWICLTLGIFGAVLNYFIFLGFIYEIAILIIGALVVRFVPEIFKDWKKTAARWQLILLVISAISVFRILKATEMSINPYVIIAMFIISSLAMYIINYKNEDNKYTAFKTSIAVILLIISIIPSMRIG